MESTAHWCSSSGTASAKGSNVEVGCVGDAQAWRLLGAAHAENDNDAQAIAAALRALDAAPSNAGVLLALGVSHVNELQEGEAVGYLLRSASNLLFKPVLCRCVFSCSAYG